MIALLKTMLIFLIAITDYQCSASFWPPIFYSSKKDTSTSSPKSTEIKSTLDQPTWIKTTTESINPPYVPLPPPPPANFPSTPINVSTPIISVFLPAVYSSPFKPNPPPPSTTYLSNSGIYPSSNDWRFSHQQPPRNPSTDPVNNQPIESGATGVHSVSSPPSSLPLHLAYHPPLTSPTTIQSSSSSTHSTSTGLPYSYRYFGHPCVLPSTIPPEYLPNLLPYHQVPLASDTASTWSPPPLLSPLTSLSTFPLFPMANTMDNNSPQKSWTHESDPERSPYDHQSQSNHHHSSSMYKPARAVAEISGPSGVTGTVVFTQMGHKSVSMEGKVMGLAPGPHGIHIYELPFIGGDCTTAGDHYNPKKTEHGGKHDWSRHIGDLGNIYVSSEGVATFEEKDLQISLHGGYSIVNRTLGISEKADDLGRGNDFQSKKDGNTGVPIACGIIHLRPI